MSCHGSWLPVAPATHKKLPRPDVKTCSTTPSPGISAANRPLRTTARPDCVGCCCCSGCGRGAACRRGSAGSLSGPAVNDGMLLTWTTDERSMG